MKKLIDNISRLLKEKYLYTKNTPLKLFEVVSSINLISIFITHNNLNQSFRITQNYL